MRSFVMLGTYLPWSCSSKITMGNDFLHLNYWKREKGRLELSRNGNECKGMLCVKGGERSLTSNVQQKSWFGKYCWHRKQDRNCRKQIFQKKRNPVAIKQGGRLVKSYIGKRQTYAPRTPEVRPSLKIPLRSHEPQAGCFDYHNINEIQI